MFNKHALMALSSALALATVISLPTVQVRAQPGAAVSPAPSAPSFADIQRAFAAADKNEDGKLDAAEFATLPAAIRARAVDANGDGFFTLAELTPPELAAEVRGVVSSGTYLTGGAQDSALNVEVTSRDDLLKTASPSVEQLIRNLSETGQNQNSGCCTNGLGVRSINLRNLGDGRSLILFDGVRLSDDPQTNGGPAATRDPRVTGGGAQNLNNVPAQVLAQIDVLQNGGSAAYGGNAVGGAVNFTPAPVVSIAPPAPIGTERYPQAEPNPIKQVATEPVSTFSIDVDTASYSNVRRYLNNGQRPPAEAVRIEELVNYFDYGYARPTSRNEPFRPFVAVAPSPWAPGKQLLHIGVQGFAPPRGQEPPLNLVFLVDTSGSMDSPDKAPLVQKSLNILTEQLRPQDRVSLVAYAGSAGVILSPTSGANKTLIRSAVASMRPGGSTAGAEGLALAYALAQQNFNKDAVNRIVMMTDGDFNVGATDNKTLEQYVSEKRQTGIYLSVYGFGTGNYQDARMQAIAQKGNGTAAYIDDLEEARKVFRDDFEGSMFPIADDVKIQVEFNPAQVSEYRLIGYETRMLRREDFNNDKVDAGEVGAGVAVTALYEITPVGGPVAMDALRYAQPSGRPAATATAQAGGELAFLKIRYKLPGQTTSKLISQPITQSQSFATLAAAPEATRWAAAVAAYGQKLRYDNYVGASFSWSDDLRLAQSARGEDEFGLRAEFIRLIRAAGELSSERAGR